MNEKLKMFSGNLNSILKHNYGGRGKVKLTSLVQVRYMKEERDGKHYGDILRFSIHERAHKQTGWVDGDKIACELKPGGVVALFRDSKTGRAIGRTKNDSCARRYIRYRLPAGMTEGLEDGVCTSVEIIPGAMSFVLP